MLALYVLMNTLSVDECFLCNSGQYYMTWVIFKSDGRMSQPLLNYSEVVPKPTRTQTNSYSNGQIVPKTMWFTRTQISEYDFASQLVPTVFFIFDYLYINKYLSFPIHILQNNN